MSTREALEATLRCVFTDNGSCRDCLMNCRSDFWPAPPHGPLDGKPVDLVMVGWNPQILGYDPQPASFREWHEHGHSKASDASEYFWWLFGGKDLPDAERDYWMGRRIVNTRMWRWPGTSGKYRLEDRECGWTCARTHLMAELRALAPCAILTYNDQAAAFLAAQSDHPPIVPLEGASPRVVKGTTSTFSSWGYPTSLVLVGGSKARSREDRRLIRASVKQAIEWETLGQLGGSLDGEMSPPDRNSDR